VKKKRTLVTLGYLRSYDCDLKSLPVCPIPKHVKVGDFLHLRDGQCREVDDASSVDVVSVRGVAPGIILRSGAAHGAEVRAWDVIAVERRGKIIAGPIAAEEKPAKTNPLAKKLSRIVCHDDPNRTMHLGITCQLSMTVKEFNALMQRAAKALNGGRKP
jgi:hypothetical protein